MNLFVYPNSTPHIQDQTPGFENTVPFSQQALFDDDINLCSSNDADYFYMGQFGDISNSPEHLNPARFQHYLKCPERHICDIEGDWSNVELPSWLAPTIKTINGADLRHYGQRIFVRPCMSKLLLDMVKSPPEVDYSADKQFVFQGLIQPVGISFGLPASALWQEQIPLNLKEVYGTLHHPRHKMLIALKLSQVPNNIKLTDKWHALTPLGDISTEYVETMRSGLLALCPRGNGIDSVRFFEACALGRVPVVIGDNILMDNERAEEFTFKISGFSTIQQIADQLVDIFSTDTEELVVRAKAARSYFDNVVVPYFQNPTKVFLDWLAK